MSLRSFAAQTPKLNSSTLILQPDPEDSIFPRTATRQGPKYQANVPPAPDPYNHPPGERYVYQSPQEPKTHTSPDTDERGGDNTVDVLGIINSLTEAEGLHVLPAIPSVT